MQRKRESGNPGKPVKLSKPGPWKSLEVWIAMFAALARSVNEPLGWPSLEVTTSIEPTQSLASGGRPPGDKQPDHSEAEAMERAALEQARYRKQTAEEVLRERATEREQQTAEVADEPDAAEQAEVVRRVAAMQDRHLADLRESFAELVRSGDDSRASLCRAIGTLTLRSMSWQEPCMTCAHDLAIHSYDAEISKLVNDAGRLVQPRCSECAERGGVCQGQIFSADEIDHVFTLAPRLAAAVPPII